MRVIGQKTAAAVGSAGSRGKAAAANGPAKDRPAAERTSKDRDLRDRLRASGLRATPVRIDVLRELGDLAAPISHAELATRLGETTYDRVTLWRILVALTDVGLVSRIDLGDHVWRFELQRDVGGPTHPHFTCVSCKTVRCLPKDSVKVASGVGRRVVEIQLKGRCEECV